MLAAVLCFSLVTGIGGFRPNRFGLRRLVLVGMVWYDLVCSDPVWSSLFLFVSVSATVLSTVEF